MSDTSEGFDLDPIRALREERAQLTERIAGIDDELQQWVRAAFDAGVHHSDIMGASGLSRARVYQVAKGTRR